MALPPKQSRRIEPVNLTNTQSNLDSNTRVKRPIFSKMRGNLEPEPDRILHNPIRVFVTSALA